MNPIPVRTLASNAIGGKQSRGAAIIRTRTEADSLLKQMPDLKSTLESVDFQRDQVVMIFAGERRTGGFKVDVTARGNATQAVVTVRIERPRGMAPMVMTTPWSLIAIPSSAQPPTIEFREG